ncbi:MAG: Fic family protein [Pseudomonadota bacterium]
MNLDDIKRLATAGESETVEFKRSTAELPRAAETLCACLSGQGGQVLIGVWDLMEHAGRANRTKFRDQVLRPLLNAGWVEMTIPEKPRSSKQRYRTTPSGLEVLTSRD